MRLRTAIIIVVMLWAGNPAGGQDSVSRKIDRLDRLSQWIEAVEQHELGSDDDSLKRVAAWDRNTLWLVWMDLNSIVSLIRDPNVLIFYTPIESEPFSGIFRLPSGRVRSRVIPYGREDIRRLQAIAKEVVMRGGEDVVLKRGAVLHADIAMSGAVASPDRQGGPRTGLLMLFMTDGVQTDIQDAGFQWEMGRRLLDRVLPKGSRTLAPNPGADETVRLWYLATGIYMQATEQMDPWHVDRSVQLFPRDPEVLFFAGCAREWLSGPQAQNALQSTTLSRDLFSLVGTESGEVRNAERLFREALERDPQRTEARIRLGRVLGRRGRHEEAIAELRRAVTETRNPLLLYYGHMFLGTEAAALDLVDEARRAYEQAGELYPMAQSPRLALSALALRMGDRVEALSTIEPVLKGDTPLVTDDPWWSYYTSQTRDIEGVMVALHVAVQKGAQ